MNDTPRGYVFFKAQMDEQQSVRMVVRSQNRPFISTPKRPVIQVRPSSRRAPTRDITKLDRLPKNP